MAKISIEQANELLSQLHADVVVVADAKEAETVDVTEIAETSFNNIKSVIEPDVVKASQETATAAALGKAMGTLRSAVARASKIPTKELEGLDAEAIAKKLVERTASQHSQTEQELIAERDRLVSEYEAQIADLTASHESALNAERTKFVERDIDAGLFSIVEKLPRIGGDIKEQAEMLKYFARKSYEIVTLPDGTLELQKDGKRAINGTKPVKLEDYAKEWAEKAGILVKDTRHVDPDNVNKGNVNKGIVDADAEFANDPMYQWATQGE